MSLEDDFKRLAEMCGQTPEKPAYPLLAAMFLAGYSAGVKRMNEADYAPTEAEIFAQEYREFRRDHGLEDLPL